MPTLLLSSVCLPFLSSFKIFIRGFLIIIIIITIIISLFSAILCFYAVAGLLFLLLWFLSFPSFFFAKNVRFSTIFSVSIRRVKSTLHLQLSIIRTKGYLYHDVILLSYDKNPLGPAFLSKVGRLLFSLSKSANMERKTKTNVVVEVK